MANTSSPPKKAKVIRVSLAEQILELSMGPPESSGLSALQVTGATRPIAACFGA